MIQLTLPVIIISLQKTYEPRLHQQTGHNRHAQADCLNKSDLLECDTWPFYFGVKSLES